MEDVGWKKLNYSDILYTFFSNRDSMCHDKAEFHFMIYIVLGKVMVKEKGKEYIINKGECVFVRKDHRVIFTKNINGGEPYQSVTLKFDRNYLRKFYHKLHIDNKLKWVKPLPSSVYVMEKSPYLDSLFLSIVLFFESDMEPRKEFVEQKLEEGIWALLNLDERFYPVLFDVAEPWKIDILDFLNTNYMYDLSMEELHLIQVVGWQRLNVILQR